MFIGRFIVRLIDGRGPPVSPDLLMVYLARERELRYISDLSRGAFNVKGVRLRHLAIAAR